MLLKVNDKLNCDEFLKMLIDFELSDLYAYQITLTFPNAACALFISTQSDTFLVKESYQSTFDFPWSKTHIYQSSNLFGNNR